jgi:hypothetical protein
MAMASLSMHGFRRVSALVLAAGLCPSLFAAEAAPAPASGTAAATSVTAAAAPKPADKKGPATAPNAPKPEEAILYTIHVGKRQVLGRTDADGRCKAYLGKPNEGWLGYADPKAAGDDYQAVSSPDGSHLALLSSRNGSINLWLLSADAREWQQLTDDDGGILEPAQATGPVLAFSPDSKRLAVIRRGSIWVLRLGTDQARNVATDRDLQSLAWSPDGRWLAYLSGSSVHKADTAGSLDVLLSAGLADQPDLAWLPDPKSESLYFLASGLRKVDGRRRVSLVVPSASKPNDIALLPGGRQAALLVPAASGSTEVFLANVGDKSGGLTQVTSSGADAVLASSLPKTLYFMRDGLLWRCDLEGLKAKPLGSVKLSAPRVGLLLPLKGVCP